MYTEQKLVPRKLLKWFEHYMHNSMHRWFQYPRFPLVVSCLLYQSEHPLCSGLCDSLCTCNQIEFRSTHLTMWVRVQIRIEIGSRIKMCTWHADLDWRQSGFNLACCVNRGRIYRHMCSIDRSYTTAWVTTTLCAVCAKGKVDLLNDTGGVNVTSFM